MTNATYALHEVLENILYAPRAPIRHNLPSIHFVATTRKLVVSPGVLPSSMHGIQSWCPEESVLTFHKVMRVDIQNLDCSTEQQD